MSRDILAVDVGTTALKLGVFSPEMKLRWETSRRYDVHVYDGEVDPFHLSRYVNEHTFPYNERHDVDCGRFRSVFRNTRGWRLTFAEVRRKNNPKMA